MIDPKSLRPGNWIHRKGSSAYGIVNGKLLALLEEDEKERERFEYIELSGELLEAAGFVKDGFKNYELSVNKFPTGTHKIFFAGDYLYMQQGRHEVHPSNHDLVTLWNKDFMKKFNLHQLQNLILDLTGSELLLPESAKIINQAVEK